MNEAKAYTVAVGNISLAPWYWKSNREFIKILKSLDGFLGVHPEPPHGTLLLFDSLNNAKGARNILEYKGVKCGRNICECYIPEEYAHGKTETSDT